MNRHQRRKLAQKHADYRQKEMERDSKYVSRLTKSGGEVISKHKAKSHRKEARHEREISGWQSGFRGLVPSTGKEMFHYVPTFRVRDGTRMERGKAWLRRGVK